MLYLQGLVRNQMETESWPPDILPSFVEAMSPEKVSWELDNRTLAMFYFSNEHWDIERWKKIN